MDEEYSVILIFNTGVPGGEEVIVKGYSVPDLIQNCIRACYDPNLDGFLEVLEVKNKVDEVEKDGG